MTKLRIDCEFEGGHSTVAEHRATWARMEIWIGDHCVTRFQDLLEQELRDGICRPLYPVVEWLLVNWWSLLYEPRRPARAGYWRRHNLRGAEEGFALPDLEFVSMGELVELRWSRRRADYQLAEFVSSGSDRIARSELQSVLLAFLEQVIHRLEKQKLSATFAQDDFLALQKLSAKEHEFCRAAGALGVDPFNLDAATADTIENGTAEIPQDLHEELFAVADLDKLQELADGVNQARSEASQHLLNVRHIRSLCHARTLQERNDSPAKAGYERARELRQSLNLNVPRLATGDDWFQMDSVLPGLDPLASANGIVKPSPWIDSFGDATSAETLGLATGKRHLVSRRFALARAVGDYLALDNPGLFFIPARDSSHDEVATARQQFNRAFAAELLAPADTLREQVESADAPVSDEEISEWAEKLKVSEMAVYWQLYNHQIARVAPAH